MEMGEELSFYEQIGVAMTCRSYEEYEAMFALQELELRGKDVLDVAAGASSFGVEARLRGIRAVGVDPMYRLPFEVLKEHGRRELEEAEAKIAKLEGIFDWSYYGGADAHRRLRERSLERFLGDFRDRWDSGAYHGASLPRLPFEEGSFDLVLCSHFLFLYAESFGLDFHREAVAGMLRVCRSGGEVRIYPLLDLKWKPYPHMDLLLDEWYKAGLKAELVESRLPFIPGSNRMLRLIKP